MGDKIWRTWVLTHANNSFKTWPTWVQKQADIGDTDMGYKILAVKILVQTLVADMGVKHGRHGCMDAFGY